MIDLTAITYPNVSVRRVTGADIKVTLEDFLEDFAVRAPTPIPLTQF